MKRLRELQRYIATMLILAMVFQVMPFSTKTVSANSSVITSSGGKSYTVPHKIIGTYNINDTSVSINDLSAENYNSNNAFVITGTGSSTRNIDINSSFSTGAITVYLTDLTWSGTIEVQGDVNLVILGDVINTCTTGMFKFGGYGLDLGNEYVKTEININSLDGYTANLSPKYFTIDYLTSFFNKVKNLNINGININYDSFSPSKKATQLGTNLTITDSIINTSDHTFYDAIHLNGNLNITNSSLDYLNFAFSKATTINITDSIVANSRMYRFSNGIGTDPIINISNSEVKFFTGGNSSAITPDSTHGLSEFTYQNVNITNGSYAYLSATNINNFAIYNSTFFNNSRTTIGNTIRSINSSILDAAALGGTLTSTPKDALNNSLYKKIVTIPNSQDTYFWVIFEDGTKSKLRTDDQNKLYPYLLSTCKKLTLQQTDRTGTEEGKKYEVDVSTGSGTAVEVLDLTTEIKNQSPGEVKVIENQESSLYVVANTSNAGDKLIYQWYKDGVLINGATEHMLIIKNVSSKDIGVYTCIITQSNGLTISSEPITISLVVDNSELIANLESQIALLTEQLAQANNDKITLQAENENLRSQIVTLNETITDLRNQITLLTNQLSESNSNNDLLVAEIESLNNQITLLNNHIAQLEIDLVTANSQKQALEVQITTLNSTVTNLNNQITALNELLATSENENEELRGQVNTLTTQISALLSQIEALQRELSTLQKENDGLKTQITDLVSENTSLLGQISNLQQLLDSANSTIEELEEQVSNLTNEVESLENQLSSANQENNVLVGKVTKLENNLKSANDSILLLENKIAALELEKLENLENIDLLNQQILELTSQITNLNKDILNLESELSNVKSERDLLAQTVSDLNNQIDGLNSQITALTERIQNGDKENTELKNKILELEEIIASLTSSNVNLQSELDLLTQINIALSEQVNALISQNTALQNEIDRLQDLLDKANMTIEELESRVEDLTGQVSNLENQLETAINDKNTLQGENDSLKSQISTLNERVNSLEQTIEQLRAEGENSAELIISLNNTIKDLNTQINSLQNDLIDVNTTISNLNNTINNLNNNIVTLENELTRLSNKIVELEEENEELKGKVADLITRVGDLETEVVKLNNEIDTLKAEKEEYQSLLADAIASFNSLRNLLDSIKEELGIEDDKDIIPSIKELKDRLNEEIRKNESLQSLINSITDDLNAAKQENLTLIDKLESIKDLVGASDTDEIINKIEELLNTIEESNRKIAQLEQEKSTLITQLNEAVNTIQELLQKIEELQENFESSSEELELIISNLQKQIEELNKENVDLQSTLEQLRKDSNDLTIENQFLKSEIVRLEGLLEDANITIKELLEKLDLEVEKNESLQTIINNITDDLNVAKQENLTLIDKLDSLKELVGATDTDDIFTKIEELLNTIEESNKRITQLEQEKNTLIEKLDDALSKIQDLLLKIEELQDIIDSSENELAKEISILKEQIVDLSKENNDLKSALEQLNNDSNELAKENQFLKSEIIRLESLLDTANSTIKELRELVASLKVENELLKTENESLKLDNELLKEKLNSNSSNGSNDGYYQEIIDSLKKEIEELKKGQISDESIILTPGDDKKESIIEENTNEIIEDKITSKPGWEITDDLKNEWVKEIEISEVVKNVDQNELTFYAREEEKRQDVYIITVEIDGQVFNPNVSINKIIHLGYSYNIQLANQNNAKVTYLSSDTNVATVSKEGVINSVNPGKAVIVGQVETKEQKYSFTINVTVKEGSGTLNLKDDVIHTTTDTPTVVMYKLVGLNKTTKIDVQSNVKGAVVSYISSDSNVVTVDKYGNVYGIKKGNATITTVITNAGQLFTYVTKVRVTDGTADNDKWAYLTQD